MKHEKSKNDAMRHELDHIDAKILNLLRENARMPLKEIAEHVFLSSPAVSARIERLEKEGYITGYQVKLNPALWDIRSKRSSTWRLSRFRKKNFIPILKRSTMSWNVIALPVITPCSLRAFLLVPLSSTSLSASCSILDGRGRRSCSRPPWSTAR